MVIQKEDTKMRVCAEKFCEGMTQGDEGTQQKTAKNAKTRDKGNETKTQRENEKRTRTNDLGIRILSAS